MITECGFGNKMYMYTCVNPSL